MCMTCAEEAPSKGILIVFYSYPGLRSFIMHSKKWKWITVITFAEDVDTMKTIYCMLVGYGGVIASIFLRDNYNVQKSQVFFVIERKVFAQCKRTR